MGPIFFKEFYNNEMNKKLISFFNITAIAILLALPVITLGADLVAVPCLPGQCPADFFKNIIDRLINIVVWPVFLGVVIIMFIWAGFLFLTAHGDPTKISTAKKAVIFAIVGIAVALLAFSAIKFIKKILGIP